MSHRGTLSFATHFFMLLVASFFFFASAAAQSATATLSGTVEDQNGAVVPGVSVTVQNAATSAERQATTNDNGYFTVPLLPPGTYTITARRDGFTPLEVRNITLNVGDQKSLQIQLKAGTVSEMVRIEGGAALVNESAAVATVVNRQFVENLPLNGRTFQSLIQLTPGAVAVAEGVDPGGFSINGQRSTANYWTVDGVSANIGVGAGPDLSPGSGVAGVVGGFSAQGGTNSLVSVDALEEFRIQTSAYAAEFGRTPGGQISIATRSGGNKFHGSVFEYFRNDVLDANDWFANSVGLPKPRERQNDFGGVFNGPIVKDKTFFFFSYEGLRLRLPQTALATVPTVQARQAAVPEAQPFVNAYPLPNGRDLGNGTAEFNATYSDQSQLDATSIRIDQRWGNKVTLFGRYNHSPSSLGQRGLFGVFSPNTVFVSDIKTQTLTLGSIWLMSPSLVNDLRFNYSRNHADAFSFLDDLGGAVPFTSFPFPSGFTPENSSFWYANLALQNGYLVAGKSRSTLQRQINIVDALSVQKGSHDLKFGVDYRRLYPDYGPFEYNQSVFFFDLASVQQGTPAQSLVFSNVPFSLLFQNLGVFAQDTWRVTPRLTLSYGLRLDVDHAPKTKNGPAFPAALNFDDLGNLELAREGTAIFDTPFGFAPRVGIAYQLRRNPSWGTLLRGGFGVFYDVVTQETGNLFQGIYPFSAFKFLFGGTFPLDDDAAAPPPITVDSLRGFGQTSLFDPNIKLPYTLQWNIAVEQAIGSHQTFTASYVGATGRRLVQTSNPIAPNPNFGALFLITNAGSSDYHALQLQFQRRLSAGLQALASYTWAHSIDTASGGSFGGGEALVPTEGFTNTRGPSSFDIRHAFSAAMTYDVPTFGRNTLTKAILNGWSLQNIVHLRSAPPVDVTDGNFFVIGGFVGGFGGVTRPDVVGGQPLYIDDALAPGGRRFNPAAFVSPPVDPDTGFPVRGGTLGRNALRGFGLAQWDFAVHRNFKLIENVVLQFRAEMFNVLNHPNFGPPVASTTDPRFGRSIAQYGRSLAGGGVGSGGLSPLYQLGGPRSIQFGLKLSF